MTESKALQEVREIVSFWRRTGQYLLAEVRWFARVVYSSLDRFYWDNGFSKAASLAYTTLLSLVPVTALIFGILASFAAAKEHAAEARSFIFQQFLPSVEAADVVIDYLAQYSGILSELNALAVVFLLFASILLINSIEYALNEIWQVYEPRTIANRLVVFSAMIVIAPVLAISAYYTARFRVDALIDDYHLSSYLRQTYNYLFPYVIDFFAFISLYYLVPKAPVRFRSAAFGAFLAALLFGIAKIGFAVYVVEFPTYQRVYGAIAAVPIFLVWLYCAWTIVLVGAELSYQAQFLPKTGKLWKRSVHTVGDGQLLLGSQALVMIVKAFNQGEKVPNDWEMAESLGCSSVVLRQAIIALEKAGIVARGDSRDMPITLMRSPETITLADLGQALSQSKRSLSYPAEMTKIFESFREGTDLSRVTLAEIVSKGRSE